MIHPNYLTDGERIDALNKAYKRLPDEQRATIDRQVAILMKFVKDKNSNLQMSRNMALEVLANLGRFLKDNRVKP